MNLATALDNLGQYAEAQKEFRAVLTIRERILGPEHPDTLNARENLADVLNNLGQYAASPKRTSHGAGHPGAPPRPGAP